MNIFFVKISIVDNIYTAGIYFKACIGSVDIHKGRKLLLFSDVIMTEIDEEDQDDDE